MRNRAHSIGLALPLLLLACSSEPSSRQSARAREDPARPTPVWPRSVERPRPLRRPVLPPPPKSSAPRLTIDLEVSAPLVKDLVPLTKERYSEQELDALFERLRELGDPVCSMLWKQKKFDRALAATFFRRKVVWKFRCAVCRRGLMAGCWNFFLMNDRAVDDDFRLLKLLYGKQGPFDCYSVSFIQPYMLHAELGCKHLTLIDLDWRILDGHYQLLRQFRAGAFATPAGMDRALAALNIGWVAYGGKMKPRLPVDRHLLCSKHGQKDLCPKYLPAFQRRFAELKEVRLQLAALHNATFDTAWEPLTKIVFLSNAIEAGYTGYYEFLRMLRRARRALRPGQKMVFVHHIAEFKGRILYELRRVDYGFELETLCRDRLTLEGRKRAKFVELQKHVPKEDGSFEKLGKRFPIEGFAGIERLVYFTHFDVKIGVDRKVPLCTELLRRQRRPRRRRRRNKRRRSRRRPAAARR